MPPSRYRKRTVAGRTHSEHRLVMEAALGRSLQPDELVHHINGDRFDNRLENLAVMSAAEHSRLHNDRHPRTKTCEVCGDEYEPTPTKRKRARTCSRPCMRALLSRLAVEREAMKRAVA